MAHDELCQVCGGARKHYETLKVLNRYDARFTRCNDCGLIAAQEPTWLDAAYSSAITRLDLGLLWRASFVGEVIQAVARVEGLTDGRFLDWAGGYGVLTRMMRDRGLNYSHHDPLCENFFALGFEADASATFDLVSAIEVLEHLVNPVAELQAIAAATDRLLVTTELLPDPAPNLTEWWYTTPETGQHITFFTPKALGELAARLGYRAYIGSSFVHLFARVPVSLRTRALLRRPNRARQLSQMARRRRPRSLLQTDYERWAERLRSEQR